MPLGLPPQAAPELPLQDAPEQGWARLHPLTPLLRGGRFFVAAGVYVGQQGLRRTAGRGDLPDGRAPAGLDAGGQDRTVLLLVLAVSTLLAIAFGFLSWRATRYRLAGAELQLDSGVLRRRSRRVPLARVQAVDVVRPLLGRVFGLAELRLEVVGGGRTEARLTYLEEGHALALRARLLAVAGGQPSDPVAAPESVLVAVPTGALVLSVLLGAPVVVLALALLAGLAGLLVDARAVLPVAAALGPALLGVGATAGRRLLAEYGFTVAESPDGLRLRHGLLDTRSQTIPAGRVQTVRLRRPLLWRWQDRARVEVDVAGYAGGRGEQERSTSALLPVAPRRLAEQLVARVLGGALPPAVAPVPRRVRWRAPLQRRRLLVGLDRDHLVVTHGALTTTTDVVPLAKVQSLRLTAGPWQRHLNLASVHVDTAGRRLSGAVAAHRDAAEAERLLVELTALARAARAPAGSVPPAPAARQDA